MKVTGIDHVVLKVKDLDRSIQFYTDILGCQLEWRRDDISLAHLRIGDSFVDLLATGCPQVGASLPLHICLRVADFDLDQARQHLESNGVVVGESGKRYGATGWGLSLYLSDPDGNALELRA